MRENRLEEVFGEEGLEEGLGGLERTDWRREEEPREEEEMLLEERGSEDLPNTPPEEEERLVLGVLGVLGVFGESIEESFSLPLDFKELVSLSSESTLLSLFSKKERSTLSEEEAPFPFSLTTFGILRFWLERQARKEMSLSITELILG